ncbi:alpha/beta fold hydrolase [Pseudonocardia nantongensis]|uniref:alpha/beta fold hydrolase n=1 Tax=Pseudonocardia nantongensis TaxID=1181885 RepID=UPI00397E42BF
MQREVEVEPGVTLWVEDLPAHQPAADGLPVLLVADGDTSGLGWPDELVERLRAGHRVLRYDHRDTGRSTAAFEDHPYGIADLATDAVTVLDACEVPRAHAVGTGTGGMLVQLLLLDAPERLASAVLLCTAALDADRSGLPGPSREVRRMWQERHDPRDEAGELTWRVEYRRRLHGAAGGFDAAWSTELERREMAHTGRTEPPTAHAEAHLDGLDRADELAGVTVPTLVVEGPEDPVYPAPHAAHLAERIGPAARAVAVEGMGHVFGPALVGTLTWLLAEHWVRAARAAYPTQL